MGSPRPSASEASEPAPTEGGELSSSAVDRSSEGGLFEAAVAGNDGGGLFEAAVSGNDGGAATAPAPTGKAGDPAAPGSSGGRSTLSFGLHGHVRGDLFVGKTVGYVQPDLKAGYGELALRPDVRAGRDARGVADLRLRYGHDGESVVTRIDVRDAYVDWFVGRLDLRLGQQIIVWGRADGINPTNVLTPIDMRIRSPLEDDRRMGNVGLRFSVDLRPIRVEGVWMPLFVPANWPALDLGDQIELAEPDYPDARLANGLGAGRVHLELPSFELSGSYVYGHAPLPGLTFHSYDLLAESPVVRLSRTAYQHHVAGFDFSTAVGDLFGLRGEAAYRHPLEYDSTLHTPNPDLQYVAGIDREFGQLSLIVQYYGRYVFDWDALPAPEYSDAVLDELADLDQPLSPITEERFLASIDDQLAIRNRLLHAQVKAVQHAISLRAEYKLLHERLGLSVFGMANVSTGEWMAYPKLAFSVADGMITSVGAEIYMGPSDTLLGVIDETLSAGYAEFKILF
ncbi:MAG: DUF1302 domain-containing protein [Myxococcales bacterium FL481]|nr:MAG: DUF1302 domain-containing protein [Myxococcales bacterium FL481]